MGKKLRQRLDNRRDLTRTKSMYATSAVQRVRRHSAEGIPRKTKIRIVPVLRLLADVVTLAGITPTFVENGRGDPP
jgi:hypothetical protein